MLISTLGATKAKACHFAAADIYVTYIGTGANGCGTPDYQYEITLIVYHACQTCYLDAGTTAPVYYKSATLEAAGSPNASGTVTVTSLTTAPDTSHQLCAQFADSNSCKQLSTASRFPAFRVRTYKGTVTLPSAQTDWRFFWSNGGRNNSNLSGCGSIYVEAGLNNVTKYNNSTPRFLSNPLPYICVGQPTTYLNAPYDPNGDSIYVYQQIPFTPTGGGVNQTGQVCGYNAGWSLADPIGSSTGYQLNPLTGSATFTPKTTGFFVLAFRGEDYERGSGQLLSYVYRDVQVTVLPCTAPPPDIDSVAQVITSIQNATLVQTPTQGEVVYVCPGSAMEFSVNSATDSTTHNVYMYANTSLLPGSNFTVTGQGSNSVTGNFTWTPTQSHIGDHSLVIESKDSTCTLWQPIVLTNYRVVLIRVVEGLDAGPDLPICELNPQPVQLFTRGADFLRLKWTVNGGPATTLSDDTIHNPLATPPVTTDYVVTTPDLIATCKSSDTVQVFIDETNKVTITPKNPNNADNALVLCRPGYIQLEALLKGKPPKNNVACGVGNPTICAKQDTAVLYGSPIYGDLYYDSIGRVSPIMHNSLRTSRMQYLVRRDEMAKSKIYSSTIRSLAIECKGTSNPTYVYSNFRIFIKCTSKEALKDADGFENFGMTQVYYNNAVTFEDGIHYFNFTTPYTWDTTKNLIIQLCYSDNATVDTGCGVTSTPPRLNYVPTTYVSGMVLKGADATVTSVCGIDKDPNIEAIQARPLFTFSYCEADPIDFVITWNSGEYLSDTTIAQPLAYVPKTSTFVVQTIGRSNCLMRDTLEVYVPEHDMRVEPIDTAFCLGDKAPFTIYGGKFFKWYEYDAANDSFLTPVSVIDPTKGFTYIGPQRSTDYRIVVSDSVWCYDTLSAKIKILPLPDVRILNKDDTTIKYGQSFQILATGARLYNWSPVSSLNNPNISYPIARPTEDTKYIVGGIATNGCRAFDTLHVIVDKKDNLFVPSAFSPNGDGKNDIFRVTNLSFQRIMEFRVFNRWGVEVFSTNDSRMGWDGNYEGKPQEMGTYTYLIRVAYPDGFVETYKGETTLIR
ncbi:MAG: gliding motility-associated C-terminal domain-containing protein [Chitinophagales bacterium]|nr:gliding motility-associated C-terminal domain-containing protein [Chitinophagales bacterium]